MALYQLVLSLIDNSQSNNEFINSFFYDVDDLLPSSIVASSLATEFHDQVVDGAGGIMSVLQTATVARLIVVTSPFDPTVLSISNINLVGLRAGTAMPKFVAWGFKSQRTRADIRAGFKRFGRISESDTAGDVPNGTALGLLNTLAGTLQTNLNPSDGVSSFIARPVIVKRIKYTSPSGNPAYRLPNDPLEYEYSVADNWGFDEITTQNSRKA